LRQRIDEEYQNNLLKKRLETRSDSIFYAACELAFKLAKVYNPESTVTLKDYLDYGDYGLNN